MRELLKGPSFFEPFTSFQRTARRMETRDRYDIPGERESFQRFLAGEPDDPDELTKRERWLGNLRAATAAGKRVERVRIVPDPLTDYLRFEIRGTRYNVDFGEDVRYLDRDRASAIDLPAHDFWVFDASRLMLMYFTADDRHLGSELVTDSDMVQRHERWVDLAFEHATPHRQYLAEDPSREDPASGRA
jgi:hypothetical protein